MPAEKPLPESVRKALLVLLDPAQSGSWSAEKTHEYVAATRALYELLVPRA